MKLKTIIITSVLACILVPFIACNATIFSFDDGKNIDDKENALTLQIYINGNKKIDNAWTSIINDFRDLTDIEVKTYKGTQVNTQLKSKWDEDNPPDFVWVDGNGINDVSLIEDNKFEDLTDWFETAEVFDAPEKTLIKDVMNTELICKYQQNKMYELPLLGLIHGAYYDKNYLDENGYEVPTNYDELLDFSAIAEENGESPLTYPGKYPSYLLWSYIMPALAAYDDITFFNKVCDGRDVSVYNDPRFKEVLERFKSYADAGYILNDSQNYSHTQAQRAWLQHEALAIANGMWLEGEVQDSLDEDPNFKIYFSTSPMILENQKTTSLIIPRNIAIAKHAKHKDNAYKFMSFLFKEENQKLLSEAYSYFTVLDDLKYDESKLTPCTIQTFKAHEEAELKIYKKYDWGTVGDIFNNVINGLVENTMTVDEGIGKIIDEARKLK